MFACAALIASDVGKLPVQITQRQTGYWAPVEHPLDALLVHRLHRKLQLAFNHLLAGVRHLLQDVHVGLDLKSARQSAAAVMVAGILLTLLVAVRAW